MMRSALLVLMLAALMAAGFLGVFSAPSAARFAEAAEYEIDASHSTVLFAVEHLGVGRFYGRFNGISGSYVFDEDNLPASSVSVTIAAASVDTNSTGRDRHLKSSDFFDAKQFPEIIFQSKKVDSKGAGEFAIHGELRMLGVQKPVTLSVEKIGEGADPWGGYRTGFVATTSIRRSDFNMNYGINNNVLGDEVDLILSVEGTKKK